MATKATSVIMGFEFVDDDFVPVRVLHDRHVADRGFERFPGKFDVRLLQLGDRFLEILHLERRARSLVRRRPGVANARDAKRVLADPVFDPLSVHEPADFLQAEDALIKFPRPVHVGDWDGDETYFFDFHFVLLIS